MQQILEQIKKIKDELNSEVNWSREVKDLRNYAFSFLERKKFTKEEEEKIKFIWSKFDLKKTGEFVPEDILNIQSGAGETSEFNLLTFSDIKYKSEVLADYVYNGISEKSDFLTLVNLSLFCGGGIMVADNENIDYTISWNKSIPWGFVYLNLINAGLSVKITETHTTEINPNSFGGLHRIWLLENSEVSFDFLFNNPFGWRNIRKEFFLQTGANLILHSAITGEAEVDFSYEVNLLENNAKIKERGVYNLEKNSKVYWNSQVNQWEKETTSDILVKGLLKDEATFNFKGIAYLSNQAENSVANIKEQGMLLSDKAKRVSQPILLVENPEVKASHSSATVISEPDQLFYLQSRGLSDKSANNLTIKGFLTDVLEGEIGEIVKEQLK